MKLRIYYFSPEAALL
jgi:hypothetical protein